MQIYNDFTNLYSLSKTLRFRLLPYQETAKFIEEFQSQALQSIVAEDEQRKVDYQQLKKLIDEYHRYFINTTLKNLKDFLTTEDLQQAFVQYKKFKNSSKKDDIKKAWQENQKDLRQKVVKCFTEDERFSHLFDAKLIKKPKGVKGDLIIWLESQDNEQEFINKFNTLIEDITKQDATYQSMEDIIELVKKFDKFATYFIGFHENRKNVYKATDDATAIANRLIHENLIKFFENCFNFEKVKKHDDLLQEFEIVKTDLKLPHAIVNYFEPTQFCLFTTQEGIDDYNYMLGGRSEKDATKKQAINEKINLFKQQNKEVKNIASMERLFKQIMSQKQTFSFIPKAFESDQELFISLKEFHQETPPYIEEIDKAITQLAFADLNLIFIKKSDLNFISHDIFEQYDHSHKIVKQYKDSHEIFKRHEILESALEKHAETLKTKKEKETLLKQDVYSIEFLHQILRDYRSSFDSESLHFKILKDASDTPLLDYFTKGEVAKLQKDSQEKYQVLEEKIFVLDELSKDRRSEKPGFEQINLIKDYLESVKDMIRFAKYLHLVKGRKPIEIQNKDQSFYATFNDAYEKLEEADQSVV